MSSSETEKQIHFYRTIFYMKHVSAGVFYAITCNFELVLCSYRFNYYYYCIISNVNRYHCQVQCQFILITKLFYAMSNKYIFIELFFT